MAKAVFADFYGTIVFEDGEKVTKISKRIYETGNAQSVSEDGIKLSNEMFEYWVKRRAYLRVKIQGRISQERNCLSLH